MSTTTSKTTVTREGVVKRDGEILGHIKKEIRQGIFATMLGVSASASGTPYYVPFAADGTQLNEYGYEKRRDAVRLIEKNAEPMTVSDLKIEESWIGDRKFVSCNVRYKGHFFGVSRYAGEEGWAVDYYVSPTSMMPEWSHGAGDRTVGKRVLKGEAHDAATRAATDAGLWPLPAGGNEE